MRIEADTEAQVLLNEIIVNRNSFPVYLCHFESKWRRLIMKRLLIMFLAMMLLIPSTQVEAAKKKPKKITVTLTAYCPCRRCSGPWGSRTALGRAKQGRTIAVDPKVIPLRTKVKIGNKIYRAEDVGGGVKGKHIDVYFKTHRQVRKFGKKKKKVTIYYKK